jgi:hypothetical protein
MVESAEFKKTYPAEMGALEFVTRLVTNLAQTANVDLKQNVPDLLARFDGSSTGRAVVLRRIAESDELFKAERDRGFVAMQYFSYFQRDPDEEGYNFWVNAISSKDPNDPTRYRSIICPFINSAEYQSRFGPTLTRQQNECP